MATPAVSIPSQNAARLADPALRQGLLSYARRRLPPGEVEDLVQSTLADALTSDRAPSDDSSFLRWVHGIARHKIADRYRRQGRLPVLDPDVDAEAPDAGTGTGELVQWIERELPKTDHAHATLHWLLRESDGESLDEIARDVALPAPRVRQRVSRLRRHLHARWLALGAAGLLLLLIAGVLLHETRQPSVPPIARESAPNTPPVAQSASGPSQPEPSVPGSSTQVGKGNVPKQLPPSKVQSNGASTKAPTKKPRRKASPKELAAPSKLAPKSKQALDYDQVGSGNSLGQANKP